MTHIRITIDSFIGEMAKRNVGAYAGSTAFFFLLSMVPTLILFSTAIPMIGLSKTAFIQMLESVIPGASNHYIYSIVSEAYKMSGSLLPITVIMLLWTCARGMLGLMYGLNQIYDVREDRGYFHLRFLATIYTVLLMILFSLMLVLMVFGHNIADLLQQYLPDLNIPFQLAFQLRYLISVIPGILILSLIYKLVPGESLHFFEQVPGAVFTVFGWIVFSNLFSLFTKSARYSLYYGSLAVVIIFMLWLYWCIYIILIGGYINWYFQFLFRVWYCHLKQWIADKIQFFHKQNKQEKS